MSKSQSPMPSPQEREEALFRAAAELQPGVARKAFLDQACTGDAALCQRLESLLAAHEQPDTLLATQAGAGLRRDKFHEFSNKDQGLAELGPPGAVAPHDQTRSRGCA